MIKVLFVCMGNICRSPTACAIFKELVHRAHLDREIEVDSAGTEAYHVGEPADARAIRFAAAHGYDLRAHRARQVRLEDFKNFDYIVVMDKNNLRRMQAMAPQGLAGKVKLLMHYVSEPDTTEVADPYYGGDEGFERVISQIEVASKALLMRIKETYGLNSAEKH